MTDTLVVRPDFAGRIPQEDLGELAELLRSEGFTVQVGYGEFPLMPEEGEDYADAEVYPVLETICIWFAQGAITTLGGAAAIAAVKTMRKRFKRERDEGGCVRCAELIEDEGAEGRVRRKVELEGADRDPMTTELTDFQGYTRKKPNDLLDDPDNSGN